MARFLRTAGSTAITNSRPGDSKVCGIPPFAKCAKDGAPGTRKRARSVKSCLTETGNVLSFPSQRFSKLGGRRPRWRPAGAQNFPRWRKSHSQAVHDNRNSFRHLVVALLKIRRMLFPMGRAHGKYRILSCDLYP